MSKRNSKETFEPATCQLVEQCLNRLRHNEVYGAISEQQMAYYE
jgi:hypothetical protein